MLAVAASIFSKCLDATIDREAHIADVVRVINDCDGFNLTVKLFMTFPLSFAANSVQRHALEELVICMFGANTMQHAAI